MATPPTPIGNGEKKDPKAMPTAKAAPQPVQPDNAIVSKEPDFESQVRHPHASFPERVGLIPGGGNCCCSSRRVRCDGCGQSFPSKGEWYICKECDYKVCETCCNLGPAEGGVVRTASVNGFHGTMSKSMVHCDTLTTRLSQTQDIAVSKTKENLEQFPAPAVEPREISRGDLRKEEPPIKSNNKNNRNSTISARIKYAGDRFGLSKDTDAEALWRQFIAQPTQSTQDGEKVLNTVRQAAQYFNFLQLTVRSHRELESEQYTRAKDQCLELYSPYAAVDSSIKDDLINLALKIPEANRSMGALVGMAVGDSIGAPFEFLEAVDDEGPHRYDLKTHRRHGVKNKFKVKPGQWTDDSSMGLCLADTLLTRGEYDGSDVRIRYHNWWFRGYNNAFGNDTRIGSVGLGGNVAQSLRAMAANQKPTPTYEAQTQDAGNGTIMRLAPVPVFFFRDPVQAAMMSAESSFATHPGPIAAAACAFQGFLIASALGRAPETSNDAAAFLELVVQKYLKANMPGANNCQELARLLAAAEPSGGKEENWNWKGSKLRIQSTLRARGHRYNGYPCTPDYFGSYCIDGLAVALWSFYHTKTYAEAVVRCTNFLGDADTTSAICGQIAGAFYGYEAILPEWKRDLQKWDDLDIACRGALLWALQEGLHKKKEG